ncbi:prothymosin alpha-A-like [Papaver somniferum]|uniref:prothymosin alpha-A-like n=1 Tax=Papaver somniferum TaxID=3469 RepID=UPI000E7006D6|nr:prothymosin alpha-A-like [Papaver somniferum]
MVTSSSDYSSSSSEEDSKIYAVKARAKTDHDKEIINNMPLDELKVARDELLKRKSREEIVADYREKRPSDSDAEEEESIWEPMERRSRPYPPHREIERLVEADLQAERDEEDYWDGMYTDLEKEFPSSDSDSEKESEEDSTEDDEDDDKSDDSDD